MLLVSLVVGVGEVKGTVHVAVKGCPEEWGWDWWGKLKAPGWLFQAPEDK